MHDETAASLLSLLFFAKKLRIMNDFFQRCQAMAALLNGELIRNNACCFVIKALLLYVALCVLLHIGSCAFLHLTFDFFYNNNNRSLNGSSDSVNDDLQFL